MPIYQDDEHGDLTLLDPKQKPKIEQPKMWAILFRNDDFTPLEFVVFVMSKFCGLSIEDALRASLTAHEQGLVKLGRWTLDIAETKVLEINEFARSEGHPLKVEPTEADA